MFSWLLWLLLDITALWCSDIIALCVLGREEHGFILVFTWHFVNRPTMS